MIQQGHHTISGRHRLLAGHDALQNIAEVVAELNILYPLFIVSAGARQAGVVDLVTRALNQTMSFETIEGVVSGSSTVLVKHCARQFRLGHHDGIIAIGGGSVIDTAKACALLISRGGEDVSAYVGLRAMKEHLVPVIAIPTVIGFGVEAMQSAIIASSRTGRRLYFSSSNLVCDVTIIDPQTTRSLQQGHIASGALASIALAIESAIGLASNRISISLALRSLQLEFAWAARGTSTPFDTEARFQLALAGYLTGLACSYSRAGSSQAIANCIGAVCPIPYALCLAILAPYTIEYHMHKAYERLAYLYRNLDKNHPIDPNQSTDEQAAEMLLSRMKELAGNLRQSCQQTLPARFYDILAADGRKAISPSQFNTIASMAVYDAAMITSPEEMDTQDVIRVLEAAYWGYPLDRSTIRRGHQKKPFQEMT